MGCFRNAHGIFTAIKALILVFLLSFISAKADDDETIVRNLCSQSLEPDLCVNCILSDKSRSSSNVSDMAYSILFCMYSEANYAHDCADQLFQNTTEEMLKEAFEVCKDAMFNASNTLWDALTKMEVCDYVNAHASATTARSDLNQCVPTFKSSSASVLVGYIDTAKRLFDVVEFMFQLIISGQ